MPSQWIECAYACELIDDDEDVYIHRIWIKNVSFNPTLYTIRIIIFIVVVVVAVVIILLIIYSLYILIWMEHLMHWNVQLNF